VCRRKQTVFVRYTTTEVGGIKKATRKRQSTERMAHEIEIKLHVKDPKELRAALKRLGAHLVSAGTKRVHEWNVVFDTVEERLRTRGELLRIRTETAAGSNSKRGGTKVKRSLLTFKRPVRGLSLPAERTGGPRRHKIREEIELQVGDAKALTTIFEGLGLRGWFCYEKFRTTFRLPQSQRWAKGLLIEWDETPIGTFLELEGPPKAIDRIARELGFARRDYIVTNYLTLYREECRRRGETPRHMVFAKGK
jgi:adenylate cyclase class 2